MTFISCKLSTQPSKCCQSAKSAISSQSLSLISVNCTNFHSYIMPVGIEGICGEARQSPYRKHHPMLLIMVGPDELICMAKNGHMRCTLQLIRRYLVEALTRSCLNFVGGACRLEPVIVQNTVLI